MGDVEDMANYILKSYGKQYIGKNWTQRFVQRQPELKTRFNRIYDFQLVENMRAKYVIQDCDFYNFDETGFMMGMICPGMVVTHADRCGRNKAVQPGNREWAIAIVCINGEDSSILPFLVVQGKNHLASWYTESGLPQNWVIKPTSNKWTNNKTGFE